MANRKKEEEGRRINLQLPISSYETTSQLAAKRKLSVSEFIRRAVDFQAWLETVMPSVEGFGADELAKIKLAHERLAQLEKLQNDLLDEEMAECEGSDEQAALQNGITAQPRNWSGGTDRAAGASSR